MTPSHSPTEHHDEKNTANRVSPPSLISKCLEMLLAHCQVLLLLSRHAISFELGKSMRQEHLSWLPSIREVSVSSFNRPMKATRSHDRTRHTRHAPPHRPAKMP